MLAVSRAYLTAGGHRVVREAADLIEYEDGDGSLFVWTEDRERPPRSEMSEGDRQAQDATEADLVGQFEREMAAARPGSRGVYLTPGRAGLSQRFVSDAKRILSADDGPGAGGVRTPGELFDAAYRFDRGGSSASALRQIFVHARTTRRVPQPFASSRGAGGDDVVEYLLDALSERPVRPCVRILDGNAGGGKTVAFHTVVEARYRAFVGSKTSPRPIAFNHTHLERSSTGRIDDLVASLIATELERTQTPEQLEWLLVNGYASWMFDGLDEVYSGDPTFFDKIGALVDAPGSVAQVLVCTRDSLMTTSGALRTFVEQSEREGRDVEVLQLQPWSEPAWRQMAWIKLEGGREGARDSERIQRVLELFRTSPVLRDLASLPFYCDEILGMAEADIRGIGDDFDVLAVIVERMLDREWDKDLFGSLDFVATPEIEPRLLPVAERERVEESLRTAGRNAVLDILQSIAHARQRTHDGATAQLPVELVQRLATEHSDLDPTTPDGRDALLALIQFAFFGSGETADTFAFSHPNVADFMAARHATSMIRESGGDAAVVREAIGSLTVPPGPVFLGFLSHAAQRDRAFKDAVSKVLTSPDTDDRLRSFLNLLYRAQ